MNRRPQFLDGVDLKKLRKYVIEDGGDGWSIWHPDKFTTMGFKADDLPVATYTTGEGKWEITSPEGEHKDTTGVWNLQMMRNLAAAVKVEYPSYMGRGFQARAIRDVVLPVIDKLISTEKPTNATKKK